MAKLIEVGSLLENDIKHMEEVNNKLKKPLSYFSSKKGFFDLIFFAMIFAIICIAARFALIFVLFNSKEFMEFNDILYLILGCILIYTSKNLYKHNEEFYHKPFEQLYCHTFTNSEIDTKKAGLQGELSTLKKLMELDDSYSIIYGYPVVDNTREDYANDCEIDFLVVGPNGAFVIENKYVRGEICGNSNDTQLTRYTEDNYGNVFEKTYKNPIRQVNRQLHIFKNFLSQNSMNMYLNTIVFFGHEDCSINLQNNSCVTILSHEDDLVGHIKNCNGKPLSENFLDRFMAFSKLYIKGIKDADFADKNIHLDNIEKEVEYFLNF